MIDISAIELLVVLFVLYLGGRWLIKTWLKRRRARYAAYILAYRFPSGLIDRFAARHPSLSPQDHQQVVAGLRQFFLAYLNSGRRFVAMPSQVVDDLWHEFILYTRLYQLFCNRAFGRFLHHTPAVVLSREYRNNAGLRRVWWHTCQLEQINPRHPDRLPLLFALDQLLRIEHGFYYTANCHGLQRHTGEIIHCGADMGDASFDGTTDGFDSDSNDGGGSDGCGGGCGGGD
ncbi:glycine-rich domain-containing protein [Thiospirillum jenense]|uniref:Uncharacterized protein n=1 Tax=Thiospirillum jenense TaxID=1653858 RepID=A0A839H9E5_9GAMM|nr:hypothetical protein [Thiospirillum jenense]MBB1125923.1 hypothetical protein [Thiospirillum jenense]